MSEQPKRGKRLTEEQYELLVQEAERGYSDDQLTWTKLPGRPRLSEGEGHSQVLSVRLDDPLGAQLDARVEAEGRTASEITRDALRDYLAS